MGQEVKETFVIQDTFWGYPMAKKGKPRKGKKKSNNSKTKRVKR